MKRLFLIPFSVKMTLFILELGTLSSASFNSSFVLFAHRIEMAAASLYSTEKSLMLF